MINLIVFAIMASTLCGVVFWLAHNTNEYNRRQRKLRGRQHLETFVGVPKITYEEPADDDIENNMVVLQRQI